ncbi:MAG TPA: GNAT family N-acetyltransferase [Candidatus Limnocylindrales bacterium]|nr:GNAT family N-acetyltransferase [Candidatus Limnocylindrales bacterium]
METRDLPHVRRATTDDAWELVRLRGIMLEAVDGIPTAPGPWQQTTVKILRNRLTQPEPTMAAFVIDRPGEPGMLAACAVGTIEERLGGPRNPSGLAGYVFNVCTEGAFRRRGYSRACMLSLLSWYRESGVERIDLRASDDGAPLYRSLGFIDTLNMRLRLT